MVARINIFNGIGLALIGEGTYLMIQKRVDAGKGVKGASWFVYAAPAAVFASLTAIFGKVGITHIESNLGTAIQTVIALVLTWLIVFVKGKQ